jgi:hypothetical protein
MQLEPMLLHSRDCIVEHVSQFFFSEKSNKNEAHGICLFHQSSLSKELLLEMSLLPAAIAGFKLCVDFIGIDVFVAGLVIKHCSMAI